MSQLTRLCVDHKGNKQCYFQKIKMYSVQVSNVQNKWDTRTDSLLLCTVSKSYLVEVILDGLVASIS